MPEKIRVGVIGTSWYADLNHLPSLKSHPQAELTAICGRNRDRAEEMAKKYEISKVFTDYREMIEKGDLQALVVAAPDDLHYQMTMEALDAGLHVVCEKPLSLNAQHAREMYEKAEEVGIKHMVFFTFRWMPPYRYLKEIIEEYIGRCYHCRIHFLQGGGRSSHYRWRYDAKRSNGMLGDTGSHMIDLARWFVGDIAKVCGHLTTFVEKECPEGGTLDPANDSAHLALEFENGAHGSIQVSSVAHIGNRGLEQKVVLHGESGTLEVDFPLWLGVEIRGIRNDEEQFKPIPLPDHLWENVDRTEPFSTQLVQVLTKQSVGDHLFIDSIIEDRSITPNFYDGLKVQEVIDAAIESHQSGRWISVK